jgi:hypothetical protein
MIPTQQGLTKPGSSLSASLDSSAFCPALPRILTREVHKLIGNLWKNTQRKLCDKPVTWAVGKMSIIMELKSEQSVLCFHGQIRFPNAAVTRFWKRITKHPLAKR